MNTRYQIEEFEKFWSQVMSSDKPVFTTIQKNFKEYLLNGKNQKELVRALATAVALSSFGQETNTLLTRLIADLQQKEPGKELKEFVREYAEGEPNAGQFFLGVLSNAGTKALDQEASDQKAPSAPATIRAGTGKVHSSPKEHPQDKGILNIKLGKTAFEDQDYDTALARFSDAIGHLTSEPSSFPHIEAQCFQAACYLKKGDEVTAANIFRRAKHNLNTALPWSRHGAQWQRFVEATGMDTSRVKELMVKYTSSSTVINQQLASEQRPEQQPTASLTQERKQEKKPDPISIGAAAFKDKKYDAALNEFKGVFQKSWPGDPHRSVIALCYMAACTLQMGDRQMADAIFRKAKSIHYGIDKMATVIEKADVLRNDEDMLLKKEGEWSSINIPIREILGYDYIKIMSNLVGESDDPSKLTESGHIFIEDQIVRKKTAEDYYIQATLSTFERDSKSAQQNFDAAIKLFSDDKLQLSLNAYLDIASTFEEYQSIKARLEKIEHPQEWHKTALAKVSAKLSNFDHELQGSLEGYLRLASSLHNDNQDGKAVEVYQSIKDRLDSIKHPQEWQKNMLAKVSTQLSTYSPLFYNNGARCFLAGRYFEAEIQFKQAIKLAGNNAPKRIEAQLYLCSAYGRQNKFEEAGKLATEIRDFIPADSTIDWQQRARRQAERLIKAVGEELQKPQQQQQSEQPKSPSPRR